MQLGANQIPLFLILGALSYLLMHEVWLLRSSWRERFHPWATGWTVAAIVFATGRLLQRAATAEDLALFAIRLQYATAITLGWLSVGTVATFASRPPFTRRTWLVVPVGALLSVLAVVTPWLVGSEAQLHVDALGNTYYAGRPGPLWLFVIAYALICIVLSFLGLRRRSDADVPPRTIRWAAALCIAFLANDLLIAAGLVDSIQLFEFGFAAIAVTSGVYVQRRANRLHQDLERAVSRRTAALLRSEERFRQLAKSTLEGVVVHRGGVIVDCNQAVSGIFGSSVESLVGSSLFALLPREAAADLQSVLDGVQTQPVVIVADRPDGSTVHLEIVGRDSVELEHTEAGAVVIRDVTERLELQQHLIRADRLASMGTLAAGTAHEINNPLSYVITNAELLSEELRRIESQVPPSTLAEANELLAELGDGAERVRRIVRDLMSVAREPEGESGSVDIESVLESSLQLARNELRHRARVRRYYEDVPRVRGSEHRLGQVFLNLLVNAAHALPEGHATENEVRLRIGSAGEHRVFVEVEDTGEGMSEEVKEHSFDPFFTTKSVGRGTGLGLAIVHGIVSSLGGDISVESARGQGTTFRVELPLAREATNPAAQEMSRPVDSNAVRRVLIVDDEPAVARSMARALRSHDVVLANSGREALQRCGEGDFDVLLCDLMMPDLTGMDVYDALASDSPQLAQRMVFITGGVFSDSARAFLERVDNKVIDKPVDTRRLRDLVRDFAV